MESMEDEILQKYLAGDRAAIETIFTLYKTRILNFCLRILGSRPDAEDVTGDVFLALFADKYKYHPEVKFSTWLFTIARNQCIDRIRKRKNQVSVFWFSAQGSTGHQPWDIADGQPLSREELEKKEASGRVRAAISRLPVEQREAIVLREYHDFSYEQISQILNCSLEKVKILIFRARECLRNELKAYMKEASDG